MEKSTLNRRDVVLAGGAALLLNGCGGGDDAPPPRPSDVPVSDFDGESTAEEVTAGIDLTGKTALVTGCNSGLGYETMRVLALQGAHVLGTARTAEKAETACASVAGKTTPLVLELTDFQAVAECSARVRDLGYP